MAQIFQETAVELKTETQYFKLKTPLCVGSLISHQHILTSKYCFGYDRHLKTTGHYQYREIVEYQITHDPWDLKVLLGKTLGRRFQPDNIMIKENDLYMDVAMFKISHDSHFSIVTLKKYVEFSTEIAPLCLPEINHHKYEGSVEGTILGFGHNKDFPDTMKSLATQSRFKERLIAEHTYDIFNATQCVNEYGKWFDGNNNWRKKWAFKRRGFVSWKDVPGYVWLEM